MELVIVTNKGLTFWSHDKQCGPLCYRCSAHL